MTTITDKVGRKSRGIKTRKHQSKKTARPRDAGQRQRIGKTLDLRAFLAKHRRNTAPSTYWETPD